MADPKINKYSLNSLYLDPNNFRFIDHELYTKVPEDNVTDNVVQRRTLRIVSGLRQVEIRDLVDSFKENGYLPVDQIQVKKVDDKKFVVIEGNRRVAALKYLQSEYETNFIDLGKLDEKYFTALPVVMYDNEDEAMHKVLMGLKHISGNKKWPAINQAQLIRSLIEDHHMNEQQIKSSIGISTIELRASQRALNLIDVYKNSDYGDNFESSRYSVFREVIKNKNVRDWLEADGDFNYDTLNKSNLERLFSWISEEAFESYEPSFDSDVDIEDDEYEQESYDPIITNHEPIIKTALEVRELGKIIKDENAVTNMEATRSLSEAMMSSSLLGKTKLDKSLSMIEDNVNSLLRQSYYLDDTKVKHIKSSISKLSNIISQGGENSYSPTSAIFNKSYLFDSVQSHFTSILIDKYKKFNALPINGLNKVNIIAGVNNSGKTSLMEAIYFTAMLGDINLLISEQEKRNKSNSQDNNNLIIKNFPKETSLYAQFNNSQVAIITAVGYSDNIDNTTNYIGSIDRSAEVTYNGEKNTYKQSVNVYSRDRISKSQNNMALVKTLLSNSNFNDDIELLKHCYSLSIVNGTKSEVIDFIKKNIDSGIIDIDILADGSSFHVTHDVAEKNLDLSLFGDGLQKIFYLGLKISACKNGVMFIDEIENGIHKSLLTKFTKFIQMLSDKYNVQIFASSHSKECIDAFVLNGYRNDEIAAYCLDQNGIKHFTGNELNDLIDYIGIDIRG
ncbi:AAA family ATPase [Vibrio coralliirubri]|uniref:AAA family ATPase n=1 Tax=Vibrio coralliirubri TaxID=1516159 RepID=UPI0006339AC5|nr:AAA family ATPase [Vibrio coralliirubri]CDT37606.1 putative ATPase [Vibrio coralliirubri]